MRRLEATVVNNNCKQYFMMKYYGKIFITGETGAGKSTLLHSLGFGAGGGISEDGRGVTREILSYELCSESAKFQVCDMPGYDEQDEVGNFIFLEQYIQAFNDVKNKYALIIMVNYNNGRIKKDAFSFINSLFKGSSIRSSQVSIIINFFQSANSDINRYLGSVSNNLNNLIDRFCINAATVPIVYSDAKRKKNLVDAFNIVFPKLQFRTVRLSDNAKKYTLVTNISSADIVKNYGKICISLLQQATDLYRSITEAICEQKKLKSVIRKDKWKMGRIRHTNIKSVRHHNKMIHANYAASIENVEEQIRELVKRAQDICLDYGVSKNTVLDLCKKNTIVLSEHIESLFIHNKN